MAPITPLPTVDIEDVELLRAGGPYFGHGSPPEGDLITEDFLDERVRDTRLIAGRIEPPFKLGHNAEQRLLRTVGETPDGRPAGGWLDPRSVRREGNRVLGTLRKVPLKLARLLAAGAFRKISAEWEGVELEDEGERRRLVPFTGVSALGEDLPAVHSMDDIINLYEPETAPVARMYAAVDPDALAAAARRRMEEDTMDLRKLLGLSEDATDEQVQEEIAKLRSGADAVTSLGAAIGQQDGESIAEAMARRDREADDARKADLQAIRDELAPKPDEEDTTVRELDEVRAALAVEREAREKLEAELPDLREAAVAGQQVAQETREMSRQALIEAWLRSGQATPAERAELEELLSKDHDLTVRMMSHRPANEHLAREYGRSERDPDPDATKRTEDETYARTMASMGFNNLASVPRAS